MNADCTILVTSCDAYRDVERPFLTLFRRYWPDCPFELAVNGETGSEPGFDRQILCGTGKTWSQMLVEALDQIATPYVVLLMNDYCLERSVDTSLILKRLETAQKFGALNLRLDPNPPGDEPVADGLRQKRKNTAYSISCKTGIWNRQFLRDLAAQTKSAWEFERYGSFGLDETDPRPLLVTERPEFPFFDMIHSGFWEPHAIELMRRENIAFDLSRRGLAPLGFRMKTALKTFVFNLCPNLVVRLQNVFNIGKK